MWGNTAAKFDDERHLALKNAVAYMRIRVPSLVKS